MQNQYVCDVVLKAQSANHTWGFSESAAFKCSGVTNSSEYSSMDQYCAACRSANSSGLTDGGVLAPASKLPPLWNCTVHTRLSFKDQNLQAGRINIEWREGWGYLVAAEQDGTRLVNWGESQGWKSTVSGMFVRLLRRLGLQLCLLEDGCFQSFCFI